MSVVWRPPALESCFAWFYHHVGSSKQNVMMDGQQGGQARQNWYCSQSALEYVMCDTKR